MSIGMNRRQWAALTLGGLAGAALAPELLAAQRKVNSKFSGVQIGAQSYSFRDRPLDEMITAMKQTGLGSCELWQGHLEPRSTREARIPREDVRKWRMETPLSFFQDVRKKFNRAGIDLYAYNYSFRDDFTDEEIDRGFQMAKALGVRAITASSTVNVAKRIDKYASKYKIPVGMHNHANLKDPNEYATPESFAKAMEGASPYIQINLDIGHYTAANFDPLEYLKQHHQHIVTIHLKDRKRDHGANLPFGEGDTPIKQALGLMRDNRWRFPANIEYEYKGADAVVEVKKCLDYCKQALAT
ncbi:MAG: sugar phosphate isomerase/epimerase [Pyrinomonadaceae bacterium]